ncbi:CDGP domain-containing protein [Mycobacterium sp. NPDC051198]
MFGAAPASAEPPPPGCERVPILGLDPHVRTICDMPIQPDGSWTRFRQQWWIGGKKSTCGGQYYQGGNCPPWLENDVAPERRGPVDEYIVTWDTIPPGEPGHVDGA